MGKIVKSSDANIVDYVREEDILRSERNMLYFPFFNLSKRYKKDKIHVTEKQKRDNQTSEVEWIVKTTNDNGLPSSIARKVHKYFIEVIINKLPRPIQNPIRVGSYRSIAEAIGIGKNNNHLIKIALEQIQEANIKSVGTFCLKEKGEKKIWIDKSFYLYEAIVNVGEKITFPDGSSESADTNYIYLGNLILNSINAGYQVPLDFIFHRSLKGEITSRLYELLSVRFFPMFESGKEFLLVDSYKDFCSFFPIIPQPHLFTVKKQFNLAITQLIEKKFLSKPPEYEKITKNNWSIKYYPGDRAIQYYLYSIGKLPLLSEPQIDVIPNDHSDKSSQVVINTHRTSDETLKTETSDFIGSPSNEQSSPTEIIKIFKWLESQGLNAVDKLLHSTPHSLEMLTIIKEDYENKIKNNFTFKNGVKAWLAWAVSSPNYQKPSTLKTTTEIKKETDTTQAIMNTIKGIAEKIQSGVFQYFISPKNGRNLKIVAVYIADDNYKAWTFTVVDENGRNGVNGFQFFANEKYFQ
jgi:hypothetical protein